MLILLLTTIILLFTLISIGDFAIKILSKWSLDTRDYNFIDKYLLGIAFLLVPLQLWSLFLPVDIFCLTICVVLCGIYTYNQRLRVQTMVKQSIAEIKSWPWWWKYSIPLCLILLLFACAWVDYSYDGEFYHYQTMFWIENYAVIPGLGNLEDRYGFNSNYLLISTLFSFNKGVFKEPVFVFNISFVLLFLSWIILETKRNKFNIKYVLLLLISVIYLYLFNGDFSATSTDLLNNLFIFYLLTQLIIDFKTLRKKPLLFFILPFVLFSFKILGGALAIFSLFILYDCYKKKLTKLSIILSSWALLLVGLWLVRNVIITGYLIYPVYQLDFFSFDWKMPTELAVMQTNFIKQFPMRVWGALWADPVGMLFNADRTSLTLLFNMIVFLTGITAFFIFLYRIIREGKNILSEEILFFASISLVLVLFLLGGSDLRFISGIAYGLLFYTLTKLFANLRKSSYPRLSNLILALFLITNITFSLRKIYTKYYTINYWESKRLDIRPASSIFIRPYPYYAFFNAIKSEDQDITFQKGFLEGQPIFTSGGIFSGYNYPMLIDYEESVGRFVNHECVKMRGNSFQEGFKTDRSCFNESIIRKYGSDKDNIWNKR